MPFSIIEANLRHLPTKRSFSFFSMLYLSMSSFDIANKKKSLCFSLARNGQTIKVAICGHFLNIVVATSAWSQNDWMMLSISNQTQNIGKDRLIGSNWPISYLIGRKLYFVVATSAWSQNDWIMPSINNQTQNIGEESLIGL